MKYLVILFTLALSISTQAQSVNGVEIKDIDTPYVRIVGTAKMLSPKVTVGVEFGQETNVWTNKDTQVKDKDGKPKVFNSMIDALNFFDKYDYEVVQAYSFALGNQNVIHYLLRRKD